MTEETAVAEKGNASWGSALVPHVNSRFKLWNVYSLIFGPLNNLIQTQVPNGWEQVPLPVNHPVLYTQDLISTSPFEQVVQLANLIISPFCLGLLKSSHSVVRPAGNISTNMENRAVCQQVHQLTKITASDQRCTSSWGLVVASPCFLKNLLSLISQLGSFLVQLA